eukprot:TRINITY_DN184_c1_g1_i18.p1 TRINITY_DN184_c1_g1~~TRINITY_DN184_c1_g1_i18.p1  ORF type:complete len:139 (-),score=20.39 TRINITY_DN184_c1_g1_i18:77-493(-)
MLLIKSLAISKVSSDTKQAVADKKAAKIRAQVQSGAISADPHTTPQHDPYTSETGLLPGTFPSPPSHGFNAPAQSGYTPPPATSTPPQAAGNQAAAETGGTSSTTAPDVAATETGNNFSIAGDEGDTSTAGTATPTPA